MHVDVGRHRLDLEIGPQRHLQDQGGGFGIARPRGIPDLNPQNAAVALDQQFFDPFAQAPGDFYFGSVPGPYFDPAFEVVDLDATARIERAGLVDRLGRVGRQGSKAGKRQQASYQWGT